jgi:hypothetical protein
MQSDLASTRRSLIRDVIILQFKLLLGAARDLALTPVTLTAAAIDLILSRRQPPRYFHRVLRLGERSEQWIDTWSAGRSDDEPQRANVDSLLASVEEVVRDPKVGAYRARVLKRWAERQMARARQRIKIEKIEGLRSDADSDLSPK